MEMEHSGGGAWPHLPAVHSPLATWSGRVHTLPRASLCSWCCGSGQEPASGARGPGAGSPRAGCVWHARYWTPRGQLGL